MWTPLILLCHLGTNECAVPSAPSFMSEAECQQALQDALIRINLPPNITVIDAACYRWEDKA